MEKPKLNENYWYIEVNTDDTWAISKRVNKMTDIDKYNFACENFYLSEDEAAASTFEMLMKLTLYPAEKVGEMIAAKMR